MSPRPFAQLDRGTDEDSELLRATILSASLVESFSLRSTESAGDGLGVPISSALRLDSSGIEAIRDISEARTVGRFPTESLPGDAEHADGSP